MPATSVPRRRRNTAKQQLVLEVLRGSDKFRSAQQLHPQIRHERPSRIGLTSASRILRGLAERDTTQVGKLPSRRALLWGRHWLLPDTQKMVHLGDLSLLSTDYHLGQLDSVGTATLVNLVLGHRNCALVVADHRGHP
jgi:hypothetical protein